MKPTFYTLLSGVLAIGLNTASAAKDCDKAAEKLESAIEKKPEEVLVLLTKSLGKNEDCACELIKVAIETTDADVALVRQIVTAAVLVEDVNPATVAECAIAARPEAASAIKAALVEVTESATVDEEDRIIVDRSSSDFPEWGNGVVSGVYMIPPIAGGGPDLRAVLRAQGFSNETIERILAGLTTAEEVIREQLRRRPTRPTTVIITTPTPQSP
ncbi:MAG: hypothetical protein AAGA58_02580 [Verrucomicrobiota bacterium]